MKILYQNHNEYSSEAKVAIEFSLHELCLGLGNAVINNRSIGDEKEILSRLKLLFSRERQAMTAIVLEHNATAIVEQALKSLGKLREATTAMAEIEVPDSPCVAKGE